MEKLGEKELQEAVAKLEDWRLEDGKLLRDFVFDDFKAAMEFVNRIADVAERAGHHPDIDIRYNKVRLWLVTHDARGITAKDVEMAGRLSQSVE